MFPVRPFDTPRTRGTDETTDKTTSHLTKPLTRQVIGYSHSTKLPNNISQVAGYQDEREMYRTIVGTYSDLPKAGLCMEWYQRKNILLFDNIFDA